MQTLKTSKTLKKIKKDFSFECKQCGYCCSGESGYIWITHIDIEKIAKQLNVSQFEFLRKYTLKVKNKITLKEIKKQDSYDCIFFDSESKKCKIYHNRPEQCISYPFWDKILNDKDYLEITLHDCKGFVKN